MASTTTEDKAVVRARESHELMTGLADGCAACSAQLRVQAEVDAGDLNRAVGALSRGQPKAGTSQSLARSAAPWPVIREQRAEHDPP